jgi:putative nucleotidyltransferase with HDIG domain
MFGFGDQIQQPQISNKIDFIDRNICCSELNILLDLIKSHDKNLFTHLDSTMRLALKVGEALLLNSIDMETLKLSAILHDVGKLAIPDEVLSKRELDQHDWAIIKSHPVHSAKILHGLKFDSEVINVCLCHHEKCDGSGYPNHLMKSDIPFCARILSVADVWDALTSDRPYRMAWSKSKAIDYMHEGVVTQFDPVAVKALIEVLDG